MSGPTVLFFRTNNKLYFVLNSQNRKHAGLKMLQMFQLSRHPSSFICSMNFSFHQGTCFSVVVFFRNPVAGYGLQRSHWFADDNVFYLPVEHFTVAAWLLCSFLFELFDSCLCLALVRKFNFGVDISNIKKRVRTKSCSRDSEQPVCSNPWIIASSQTDEEPNRSKGYLRFIYLLHITFDLWLESFSLFHDESSDVNVPQSFRDSRNDLFSSNLGHCNSLYYCFCVSKKFAKIYFHESYLNFNWSFQGGHVWFRFNIFRYDNHYHQRFLSISHFNLK